MITLLEFGRREVARGAVEPTPVPPVDPLRSGELDLLGSPPGSASTDELGLVETHDGLGERVVVAVAARTNGGDVALFRPPLRVATRQILHAPVGAVNERNIRGGPACPDRHLQRVQRE